MEGEQKGGRMPDANRDTRDEMWHTFSAPSFTQEKHQKEQLIIQQSLLSAGAVLGTADRVMMRKLQNTALY